MIQSFRDLVVWQKSVQMAVVAYRFTKDFPREETLQTQLEIARGLGMGNPELLNETEGLSHEVGKMIFGVLESIKESGSAH